MQTFHPCPGAASLENYQVVGLELAAVAMWRRQRCNNDVCLGHAPVAVVYNAAYTLSTQASSF